MTSNYNKFTFLEYKNILTHIKSIYNFKLVSDKLSKIDKKICVLRHDVDMSPENALEMAKIEKILGIKSSYYALFSSRFYNLLDIPVLDIFREIIALGHEVGLHFDAKVSQNSLDKDSVFTSLKQQINMLSDLLSIEIKSFTIHDPDIKGKIKFDDEQMFKVKNGSSQSFLKKFKYFSDSNGKWGNNNLSVALKTIKYENIYLLTHPVWWSNTKKSPREKINDCIKGRVFNALKMYDKDLEENKRPNIAW